MLAVFLATAIAVWLVVVSLSWMVIRGPGLVLPSHAAAPAHERKIVVSDEAFGRKVREQFLTGADCAAAIAGLDERTLWSTLRSFDPPFWRTNPNASMLLRQAARLLTGSRSPERVLREVADLLQPHRLADERIRRLSCVAFAGVLEAQPFPREALNTLLHGKQHTDALALLEVWLDFQKPNTPLADLETAKQIMAEVTPNPDPRQDEELAAMIVRLWAHRAPPVADALLFAKKFEKTKSHQRLLLEGARLLAVTDPDELQHRLIQFAPVMARDAGYIASQTGTNLPHALAMAKQMSEKDGDEFLKSYLSHVRRDDPREIAKMADLLTAKEAPKSIAGEIVAGLTQTRDLEGIKAWLSPLDTKAKAELYDTMVGPFRQSDASAARFYLKERPRNVEPNIWAVMGALNALPYKEAMDSLHLAGERTGQFITQLPEEITRNELWRLQREEPDRIPEFLGSLPSALRVRALGAVLDRWNDPGTQTMQEWADATGDPQARSEIHNQSLNNELTHGRLSEISDRLCSLLQNDENGSVYGDVASKAVSLHSSSSSGVAFLARLPEGAVKDKATVSFAKRWSDLDPVPASEWLAQLPPGRTRDLAARELISAVRDDPERALANAAGIQDPQLRFEAARTVLQVWRNGDPAVVSRAISAAGFPMEDLPQLRAMGGLPALEERK